jgi:hypothetical protein
LGDWLKVVWNREPLVLLRKQRMLALNAFKNHLTLDARSVIHAMNTDFIITGSSEETSL